MRTQDGIDEALLYVQAGNTEAEKNRRSTERGVVVPPVENPTKKLTFDRVRMVGVDVFIKIPCKWSEVDPTVTVFLHVEWLTPTFA